MAVTYQSTQSAASGTVTKPVSTTTNDLLIAFVTAASTNATFTAPADTVTWTALTVVNNATSSGCSCQIFYKIAGSAEPASYAFTSSATISNASISRFTGHDLTTPMNTSLGTADTNSSKTITLAGITPSANSMIGIFTTSVYSSGTTAGYGIVTSDPGGWNEIIDRVDSAQTHAIAVVIRAQATSTGNATAAVTTGDAAGTRKAGYVIAIGIGQDVTVSADLVSMTGSNGDPDYYVDVATPTASLLAQSSSKWSTQTKHTGTSTNQTKH